MRKSLKKHSADDEQQAAEPPLTPVCLAECAERDIDWLWDRRIPLGKVTLLVGDPDTGKSFFALDLAARVSRGEAVPPEAGLRNPGNVLLLSADDDLQDTILPRLRAAGADLNRTLLLPSYKPASNKEPDRLLSLSTELERFQQAVDKLDNLRLIVIDPITAYLRGATACDHYSVRQLLQRLVTIARRKNAAVLVISHQRKQNSVTAVHRPLGSLAFAAVARSVLLITPDPAVIGRRLLLPAKMTLHSEPSGRAFSIEDRRIVWEPAVVPLSSDDLKEMISDNDNGGDQRLRAKEWLIEQLERQRVPAEEMIRRAHELRIPLRILKAAKKDAKVRSVYDGREQRWYWKLPDLWIRDTEGWAFPTVI